MDEKCCLSTFLLGIFQGINKPTVLTYLLALKRYSLSSFIDCKTSSHVDIASIRGFDLIEIEVIAF